MRFGGYIIGLRQALFPCRPLGQTARSGGCSAQVVEAHIQKNVFVIVFGFGSVTSMWLNPKFCVNSQRGENRSEFIVSGSGFIRLPLVCSITPAGMDVKGGGKAAVHRSAAHSGAQTLDVRLRRCYSGMRPAK